MSGKVAAREMSFLEYLRTRRYQLGRVSERGWKFVASALGDPALPDAQSWRELRAYLERCWDEPAAVDAAQVIWNSYLALLAKKRRARLDDARGRGVHRNRSIVFGAV